MSLEGEGFNDEDEDIADDQSFHQIYNQKLL